METNNEIYDYPEEVKQFNIALCLAGVEVDKETTELIIELYKKYQLKKKYLNIGHILTVKHNIREKYPNTL